MPGKDSSRPYKQIGEALLYVQQIMVSYLHAQPVDSVCFSPDGALLASAASGDCVHLWNVAERKPVSMLEGRTGAAGTVWIWEMSSRQIVGSFAAHPEGPDYRKNAQEWALGDIDWSSDGRYLVSCGRDPYTVKLWKVRIRV